VKRSTLQSLSGKELVKAIIKASEEKLAEKITTIQMDSSGGIGDYFVICQGDTTVHTQAIASGVVDTLSEINTRPWHIEGTEDGRWIVVDFSDVVLHVMIPELHDYYELEKLGHEVSIT
jgi:ribosome-associated protein